eukprot:3086611-Lingulodinium_polyedra.AAC.1
MAQVGDLMQHDDKTPVGSRGCNEVGGECMCVSADQAPNLGDRRTPSQEVLRAGFAEATQGTRRVRAPGDGLEGEPA